MRPGMGIGNMGGAGARQDMDTVGGMNTNIPRGPRGGPGGPGGAMGVATVGPQRRQRGQHNFHSYAGEGLACVCVFVLVFVLAGFTKQKRWLS